MHIRKFTPAPIEGEEFVFAGVESLKLYKFQPKNKNQAMADKSHLYNIKNILL